MQPFTFESVSSERQAIEAVAAGARVLAGGTTLVDLMKLGVEHPARVVDISGVPWTSLETLADGTIRIGALALNADMAAHEGLRSAFPAVAEAIVAGASPQIRNMATTGGNLLQRTRCSYFRDTASACNKRDPGSGCAAMDGHHRTHAVLGTSDRCIATHPSDLCVALAAFDAVVQVRSASSARPIRFTEFHLEPGDHPDRETVLAPDEVIVAVDLHPLSFSRRSTYVKVRDRASYAFALASAAVALDIGSGRSVIREARVAIGGVATKPWRAVAAERSLVGQRPGPEAYRAAAEVALEGAVPRAQNAFKIELAKRTIVRALTRAEGLS